jgi:hypothetical protein
MTDLTEEQKAALIEALEPASCGYVYSPSPPAEVIVKWYMPCRDGIVAIDRTEGISLTPAGRLLAQAYKRIRELEKSTG